MKFDFIGDIKELEKGIRIMKSEIGFDIGNGGIPVMLERRPGNIEVELKDGRGVIRYAEKVHFFRALGLLAEAVGQESEFNVVEEPQFKTNGAMFDVSRNAVMKVDTIKKLIKKMAFMGLNMVMLYTEDTYTIENNPYFGYLRGRYTYDELKECDDYADIFGIEMIPCIQTLAHLEEVLKWECYDTVRDTTDNLLVGEEKTYALLEDMIQSASAPFRSKRIHIGMDEACSLGFGAYLSINGYRRRFDIMKEHLKRVVAITDKYGLQPMLWSDMFFRLASKNHDYYDLESEIPKDVINEVPEKVGLVYWDAGHDEEHEYAEMMKRHKKFKAPTIFAGGLNTCFGFCTNLSKTFSATKVALSACKKEGVREIFATAWMDNGAENNVFSALLGLQLFAELGYSKEYDESKLRKRFKFCTGCEFDDFTDLRLLDEVPGGSEGNIMTSNPSKYFLWQDLLLGIFDKNAEGLNLNEHYRTLAERLKAHADADKDNGFVYRVPAKLADVLSLKTEMGLRIKEYYDKKDRDTLRYIAQSELPEIAGRVREMMEEHRTQWFNINKAFGWEVLNIRYCGLIGRIEAAIMRVMDYVNGKIDKIEELEENKLLFQNYEMLYGSEEQKKSKMVRFNRYIDIVTACPF